MSNLLTEIYGVRDILGNPMSQSPSVEDIATELQGVYQEITNLENQTGQAWGVDTLTITTTAGLRVYELDPALSSIFYKALLVTTVPVDDSNPEYTLEFTELEHLPQEWAWLGQNQGTLLYSSHSACFIAFYRKMTGTGEVIYCEMRPTPVKVEQYKILFQIGDWWASSFTRDGQETDVTLPNKEFRYYFRAKAALNLLPKAVWDYDEKKNAVMYAKVEKMLMRRVEETKEIFLDHIASLDQSDQIVIESWADEVDPYAMPLRYNQ